jgi:2-amino-4-hydroxy-6-hydroxymethyldihydropteridine diphosphokinase
VASFDDLQAVSGLYVTDPVGGPDQDSYLNIVIELDTNRGARELLEHAQMLEKRANRKREIRWGPRTLDVDVLWVDDEQVNEPDLIVPHPRMQERAFVMIPLGELDPMFLEGWNNPNEGEVRRLRDW